MRSYRFAKLWVALFSVASLLSTVAFAADQTRPTTVQPVPRNDEWWQKRHESFNKRVNLIFIGDSITHGWEGGGKEVWKKYYEKRNAVNLGIGGDQTQHVLWRLDHGNIDGISPKLAVLMIGTNNAGSDKPEEIAAGVKAIVEKLRTKLPQTKVLVLAIFPRGADTNDDRCGKSNAKANAIIAKLADDKTVFYLDIGPKFLATDGTLRKDIMPDLLAPERQGLRDLGGSHRAHRGAPHGGEIGPL